MFRDSATKGGQWGILSAFSGKTTHALSTMGPIVFNQRTSERGPCRSNIFGLAAIEYDRTPKGRGYFVFLFFSSNFPQLKKLDIFPKS